MHNIISKKSVIITVLIIAFGAILFLITQYGYISVKVINPGPNNSLKFTLYNQKNNKTTEIKSRGNGFKKLVWRGSYEVTAKLSQQASFNVVKVGGFFRTRDVQLSLSNQAARQFVGNSPEGCMYSAVDGLYSYPCTGDLKYLVRHVPATPTQPTYLAKNTNPATSGIVEGSIVYDNKTLVLLKLAKPTNNKPPRHVLYEAGANFGFNNPVILGGTDAASVYSIQPFRTGFIIYNSDFSSLLYYNSPSAQPEKIHTGVNPPKGYSASLLRASGETLFLVYTNSEAKNANLDSLNQNRGVSSFVVTIQGKQVKQQRFDGQIVSATACGNNIFCYVSGKVLFVYNTSAKKPKLLFRVNKVSLVDQSNNEVILAKDSGLYKLDTQKQSASMLYDFGSYNYCGSQADQNVYLVCIISPRGIKSILALGPGQDAGGLIDQKLIQLENLPEVKAISPYKNYIYIAPNLGQLIYDPTAKEFTYDPVVKKRVADVINARVDQLKIDRKKYQIINSAGN